MLSMINIFYRDAKLRLLCKTLIEINIKMRNTTFDNLYLT